jgi:tyrosine-protein kinase Etk/Wzc
MKTLIHTEDQPVKVKDLKPERDASQAGGLSLLDVLVAVAGRKLLAVSMTLAGGLLMAAVAMLLPPMYTATTTIVPPQQQQSTASALLGQLAPIAAAAGGNLGIKTPAELYVAILGSRTIADDLIHRFNLREIYQRSSWLETREMLARRSHFSAGGGPLIRIAVEDRDPKRAAALANAYLEALAKQNQRLALTESAQRRLFFEGQLDAQKKSLAEAEAVLKETQERTGVLQVNAQVESTIGSLARLRAEVTSREVALSSLKNAATPQNPEVIRQETEIATLREQLRDLEVSRDSGPPGDPLIPTGRVPKAGLEYVRALREVKYNETLFELIARQYEVARIDEAKDAPVIQIVDQAIPPERKTWPPRMLFALAGAMAGGVLATAIAVMSCRPRNPEEAAKFLLLRRRLIG